MGKDPLESRSDCALCGVAVPYRGTGAVPKYCAACVPNKANRRRRIEAAKRIAGVTPDGDPRAVTEGLARLASELAALERADEPDTQAVCARLKRLLMRLALLADAKAETIPPGQLTASIKQTATVLEMLQGGADRAYGEIRLILPGVEGEESAP